VSPRPKSELTKLPEVSYSCLHCKHRIEMQVILRVFGQCCDHFIL
jgi:hypothetical protein